MFLRAAVLFALLILTPNRLASTEEVDTLQQRVLAFEKSHDRFVRRLFGCPDSGIITETSCRPKFGYISYGDYTHARKSAARLYALHLHD